MEPSRTATAPRLAALDPDHVHPVRPAVPLWVLLAAFALIGLNLRTTFGAIPPVLDDIADDLNIPSSVISLVTAIPVLLMGVLAPLAQRFAQRVGVETATTVFLVLLSLGPALRIGSQAAPICLIFATLVTGVGMSGIAVLGPALISHYCRDRSGLATSFYSTAMGAGAAGASWLAVPLVSSLGSWSRSISFWAIPAAVAAALWALLARRLKAGQSTGVTTASNTRTKLPWSDRTARLVAISFAAQTFIGFSAMTWLAPAYKTLGWSASSAASVLTYFVVVQCVTMMVVPVLAERSDDRRPLMLASAICTSAGLLIVAIAPSPLAWVAMTALGIGVGGVFALGLMLIVDYSKDRDQASRLAAMAFTLGYTLAAFGPITIGLLHDLTGGYRVGYLVLFVVSLIVVGVTPKLRPGRVIVEANPTAVAQPLGS